jgi:N-acetyl-anhydromuramyl-L-alanine amidase AmpD
MDIIPNEWKPLCKMDRIILHWTAGNYTPTDDDKLHYHILIDGDADLVRGAPPISGNARPARGMRASHTLNCNTGSIGVSMCAMAGAKERPFDGGKAPLKRVQWTKAAAVIADLCRTYGIPVSPKTVLTHAEVQANLGITQRGKWDIARLPWDARYDTPRECGDQMRAMVSNLLD